MEFGFIAFVGIGMIVSGLFTYFVAHTAEKYHKEHPICDVNAVIKKLNDAGGCDAHDEYGRGWDDAITYAIEIVRKGGAE